MADVANDRTAKLTIETVLNGTEEAAAKTADLRTEHERLGSVAGAVASELQDTAASVDKVAAAENAAAAGAVKASGAIDTLGTTGTEAGAEIAAGAARAEAGIEEIGDSATVTAREVAAATAKIEQNVEEVVAAIRQEIAAVRESGAAHRDQLATLRQMTDQLQQVADAHRQANTAGSSAAKATDAALDELRRQMGQVSAEIDKQSAAYGGLSEEAQAALANIRTAQISVNDAITIAAKEIQSANEQYEETGRIAPKQLGAATQAVETLKIAMQNQGEVGEVAARQQTAALAALESQLEQATARANALRNAVSDNAVGLQETGNRIAGLGFAAQDLGSALGPTGAAIGTVAARLGLMGANIEQAKDAIHGLNINQLGAAKGAAGLAAQVAIVTATFVAAAAAGLKIAETNEANAESVAGLKKDLIEFGRTLQTEVKDRAGALNGVIQNLIPYIVDVGDESVASADGLKALGQELAANVIRAEHGVDAQKLYYELLRQGFSVYQASAAAANDNRIAIENLNRARENGGRSLDIWADSVRAADGDADALVKQQEFLKKQLEDEAKLLAKTTTSQKDLNAARKAAVDIAKVKADTENRLLTAQEAALAAVSSAQLVLDRAQQGTTAAITAGLTVIRDQIGASDQNSIALRNMAGALQTALDMTDGLTQHQRANIQVVIDAALRGEELTATERRYVEQLAASIAAGKNKTNALLEQIEANERLNGSIASLIETVQAETEAGAKQLETLSLEVGAIDAKTTAIGRAAAAAAAELAANNGLDASRRAQLETIVEAAKRIDDLQKAEEKLIAAKAASVEATNKQVEATRELNDANEAVTSGARLVIGTVEELQAARDASFEAFQQQTQENISTQQAELVVLSGRRFEVLRQIEDQKRLIAATAAQDAANAALVVSTDKIRVVSDGVRSIYSNTTTELERLRDRTGEVSEAVGNVLVSKNEKGKIAVESLGDSGEAAGIKLGKNADAIERTGKAADAAAALMRDQMITVFDDLDARADRLIPKMAALAEYIEKIGTAAGTAAGSN